MNRVMLDASAVLAFLRREPGFENVPVLTGEAAISAVNYAEIVSVMTMQGIPRDVLRSEIGSLVLEVIEFSRESAEAAGLLIAQTKLFGLSLGDRACLAEAARRDLPVVTADRAWKDIDIGISIRLIR